MQLRAGHLYEQALKAYLRGDMRFSAKPDVQKYSTDATLDTNPTAGPEILRETASKPKDQVIAELAPKLQKPGTTPGRATIAAQQTYADAQKRFGSNANTVLEHIQQGQDPRRFLDGFQNAYILGKQGAGPDALNNSSAAAHLTVEQRQLAYDLGSRAHDTRYRATLDIVNGNGTMDSDGFWIGRSLGAKAKNYKVLDLETGEYFYFVEGTGLKNVEVFAGPNSRKPYEKAYKFAEKYGGAINDWQHVKGVGWLETPEGIRLAEVHWSQCAGIGKVEFFVKKWKDE